MGSARVLVLIGSAIVFATAALAVLPAPRLAKDPQGHWGYVDSNGKVVPDSAHLEPLVDGVALACLPIGREDNWGLVDESGKWVLEPQFAFAEPFSDGLAMVRLRKGFMSTGMMGKSGFIDKTGRFVIEPKFTDAHTFSEGLASVLEGDLETGKYGYIDTGGKYVIKPQFDAAKQFREGLAPVGFYKQDWYGPDGHTYHRMRAKGFKSYSSSEFGYIDKTGKLVIAAQFGDAEPFSEGMAAVRIGGLSKGKWGFIDMTGKLVIDARYDEAEGFWHGNAQVKDRQANIYGLIDKTGKLVLSLPLGD